MSRWERGEWSPFTGPEQFGAYWDAIKSAGHVVATASVNDEILARWFAFGKKVTLEPFPAPLGIITKPDEHTEYYDTDKYGTLTYVDRYSPVETMDISPATHSSIFDDTTNFKKVLRRALKHLDDPGGATAQQE